MKGDVCDLKGFNLNSPLYTANATDSNETSHTVSVYATVHHVPISFTFVNFKVLFRYGHN
jgi:hypothetical protein